MVRNKLLGKTMRKEGEIAMKPVNNRHSSAVWWLIGLIVALTATTAVPSLLGADQATEDRAFFVAKGRVTYRVYCINCHGPKGAGDGTLSEMLSTKPADLTQLKAENDGKYPADKVRDIIDGRKGVRGHGSQEMPIWGDVFQTSSLEPSGSDETAEERARRKVHELVLYLESIQK
jgi:mono/diheme cytochrome c family protein